MWVFQRLAVRADVSDDPPARRLHGGLHSGEEAGHLHGPLSFVPLPPGEPAARQPKKHTKPGSDPHPHTLTHTKIHTGTLLVTACFSPLQVTLSYGMFENKMNSIEVKGSFSKEEDPSRFVGPTADS